MVDTRVSLTFAPPLPYAEQREIGKLRMESCTDHTVITEAVQQRMAAFLSCRDKLSVLVVGDGQDWYDKLFDGMSAVARAGCCASPVMVTVVEPDPVPFRGVLSAVQRATPELVVKVEQAMFGHDQEDPTVKASFTESLEDLFRSMIFEGRGAKYDLIFFLSFPRYIVCPAKAVCEARTMLSHGGTVTIFHESEVGMAKLRRDLDLPLKGDEGCVRTAEMLRERLAQTVPCELSHLEASIDLTEILRKSPQGLAVLSHLLECRMDLVKRVKLEATLQALEHDAKRLYGAKRLVQRIGVITLQAPEMP
eukprot:Sspe_Gene.97383::Locus_70981_Transcript_1_1_Confidence_1.000_Length_1163::g.97383::m.97383